MEPLQPYDAQEHKKQLSNSTLTLTEYADVHTQTSLLQKIQAAYEAKIIQITAGGVVRPKTDSIVSWILVFRPSRTGYVKVKWSWWITRMLLLISFSSKK